MAGAKREIKDPILKRIGWERAAGFATTVGIIGPAAVWGGMPVSYTHQTLPTIYSV